MIEHDFSTTGSYTVAAIQMLLTLSVLFQGMMKKYSIRGWIRKTIMPYFYSFSPVALLVYLLYAVSYNLR